jgi:hypothetical protein
MIIHCRGPAGSAAGAGRQEREGVGGQKVISLDFRAAFPEAF